MKQLYLFVLAAILALGATFRAEAYTATFEWDEPGTVVFGTSFANPFTNNGPETTSYVYNGTTTVYVKAAEGYYLKSITRTSTDPEKTMTCTSNASYGRYGMVSFSTIASNVNYPNDGATFKVEVEKIVYDGTISVNLINASQYVTAKMGGTGRSVTFKTGNNTLKFSKEIETNITFEVSTGLFNWTGTNDEKEEQFNQMVADGNLYIKKNGENVSGFNMFYGSLRLPSNIAISDGDSFEAKFTDMVDENKTNVTVTLDFADENAKSAFGMVFNATDNKKINLAADNTFEIEPGKTVRFSFSHTDYVVSVKKNGVDIPASAWVVETNFDSYSTTIDENTTFVFTAKERVYGTTSFNVYVNGIENLTFRYGNTDGDVIPTSDFVYVEDWSGYIDGYERSYKKYRVTVSAKTPKIFFDANEGYYIAPHSSFCARDGKTDASSLSDATVISASFVTYIDCKKITVDSKLVVFCNYDVSKTKLKDGMSNIYPLELGYNVFDFDPAYANGLIGFSVIPYVDENLSSTVAVAAKPAAYLNDETLTLDENGNYTYLALADNDVLRIHGIVLPKYTITADVTENNCSIVYDKVRKFDSSLSNTFAAYEGAEVAVTPAKDYMLSVDGDDLALEPDMAYTFNVTGNHNISVRYVGTANIPEITPDDAETVKEFNGVTVSFPNAESVEFVGVTDEITFSTPDERWAVPGIDPLKVEKVDSKTFKISFKNADLTLPGSGDYCYFIPEGAFLINGDILNKDIRATFTYEIEIETVPHVCSPWDPTPASNQNPSITIGFCEYVMTKWGPDVTTMYNISDFNKADADKVKVTFAGKEVEYNATLPEEDGKAYFSVQIEGCFFMVNTVGLKNKGGDMVVTIPAGLFNVNGKPVPEIVETFTYTGGEDEDPVVIEPGFSTPEGTFMEEMKDADGNHLGFKVSDVSTITIAFEGVKTAEVFNDYGIRLKTKGSYAYSKAGTIVKRAATRTAARAASAEGTTHIFDVTFPNAPTTNGNYELTIAPETFTIDSKAYPEEQVLHNYTLDVSTGVLIISVDNSNVTVYSVDGKALLLNADRSELSNLQPGLYIINGKKQVVK